jgi:hypothetical protein
VEEVGAAPRHSCHTRVSNQLTAAHRQLAQLRKLLSQLAQPVVGDVTLSQIQRSAKEKNTRISREEKLLFYFTVFANSFFAKHCLSLVLQSVPLSTITSRYIEKSKGKNYFLLYLHYTVQ